MANKKLMIIIIVFSICFAMVSAGCAVKKLNASGANKYLSSSSALASSAGTHTSADVSSESTVQSSGVPDNNTYMPNDEPGMIYVYDSGNDLMKITNADSTLYYMPGDSSTPAQYRGSTWFIIDPSVYPSQNGVAFNIDTDDGMQNALAWLEKYISADKRQEIITSLHAQQGTKCTIYLEGNLPLSSSTPISSSSSSVSDGNPAGFYDLSSDIVSTIYQAGSVAAPSGKTYSGSFDLNGSGKSDSISLTFYGLDSSSVLKINSGTLQIGVDNLMGIYVVDLVKSDNFKEVAVIEQGPSGIMTAHLFRYDGSGIIDLGQLMGDMQRGGGPYNSAIKTNGKGTLIPFPGIMEFISPVLVITEYQLSGNQLNEIYPDISGEMNKQYTLSMDISPFFSALNPVPSNFIPSYENDKIINLKKGQTITIMKVNDVQWIEAKLPDGRQGALYFYVLP